MSFLPSPYDRPSRKAAQKSVNDELLVFGYSCKLYRNDRKAEMEDSGALLIPWMGDSSLMIDRYDIRNRLEDKAQFGIKPILPQRLSQEEEKMEKELDRERYLALGNDILEVELGAEEEEKRMYEGMAAEGTFHAVDFHYDSRKESVMEDKAVMVNQPQLPEHPPTTSVDFLEEDREPYSPAGLDLPEDLITPLTQRIHSIIERTARFVHLQGQQMEIIIKAKQKFNPYFSFLIPEDRLYHYYRWLLHAISSGEYPGPRTETKNKNGARAGDDSQPLENCGAREQGRRTEGRDSTDRGRGRGVGGQKEGEESDSDDDSDEEGFELHPLLRTSLVRKKSPSPPKKPLPDKELVADASIGSFVSPVSTKAFRHIALSMNSAPSLAPTPRSSSVQPHPPPHPQGNPGTAARFVQPILTLNGAGPPPYPAAHPGSAPVYPAYGYPVYDMRAAYYQASHQYMTGPAPPTPGPVPPPPDIQPIVIKTAEYVAKNGEGFEKTVLEKHLDDPRFEFLSPWHRFHAYYKMKIAETRQRLQQQLQLTQAPVASPLGGGEVEEVPNCSPPQLDNVQRLSSDGSVSFKLTSKSARVLPPRLDLGGTEEDEEEDEEEEELKTETEYNGEREPDAKRPHVEPSSQHSDMLDNKVQEFLVTVKAMLY